MADGGFKLVGFVKLVVVMGILLVFLGFSTFRTQAFFKARFAGSLAAFGTMFGTAAADAVFAEAAFLYATCAARAITHAAGTNAFTAEVVITPLAVVTLVFVDDAAAVVAGVAVPVLQGHIRGVAVVGFQDRAHQDEKVADAAFGQCAMDGGGRVSLA